MCRQQSETNTNIPVSNAVEEAELLRHGSDKVEGPTHIRHELFDSYDKKDATNMAEDTGTSNCVNSTDEVHPKTGADLQSSTDVRSELHNGNDSLAADDGCQVEHEELDEFAETKSATQCIDAEQLEEITQQDSAPAREVSKSEGCSGATSDSTSVVESEQDVGQTESIAESTHDRAANMHNEVPQIYSHEVGSADDSDVMGECMYPSSDARSGSDGVLEESSNEELPTANGMKEEALSTDTNGNENAAPNEDHGRIHEQILPGEPISVVATGDNFTLSSFGNTDSLLAATGMEQDSTDLLLGRGIISSSPSWVLKTNHGVSMVAARKGDEDGTINDITDKDTQTHAPANSTEETLRAEEQTSVGPILADSEDGTINDVTDKDTQTYAPVKSTEETLGAEEHTPVGPISANFAELSSAVHDAQDYWQGVDTFGTVERHDDDPQASSPAEYAYNGSNLEEYVVVSNAVRYNEHPYHSPAIVERHDDDLHTDFPAFTEAVIPVETDQTSTDANGLKEKEEPTNDASEAGLIQVLRSIGVTGPIIVESHEEDVSSATSDSQNPAVERWQILDNKQNDKGNAAPYESAATTDQNTIVPLEAQEEVDAVQDSQDCIPEQAKFNDFAKDNVVAPASSPVQNGSVAIIAQNQTVPSAVRDPRQPMLNGTPKGNTIPPASSFAQGRSAVGTNPQTPVSPDAWDALGVTIQEPPQSQQKTPFDWKAHNYGDLTPPKEAHVWIRPYLCRHYLRGYCRLGNRCFYMHDVGPDHPAANIAKQEVECTQKKKETLEQQTAERKKQKKIWRKMESWDAPIFRDTEEVVAWDDAPGGNGRKRQRQSSSPTKPKTPERKTPPPTAFDEPAEQSSAIVPPPPSEQDRQFLSLLNVAVPTHSPNAPHCASKLKAEKSNQVKREKVSREPTNSSQLSPIEGTPTLFIHDCPPSITSADVLHLSRQLKLQPMGCYSAGNDKPLHILTFKTPKLADGAATILNSRRLPYPLRAARKMEWSMDVSSEPKIMCKGNNVTIWNDRRV